MQLFRKDVFLRAQLLNVGHADVRHHRVLRAGNLGQTRHFPEIAHAHLDHGHLMLGKQAEHGERKSHLAVLIPLGFHRVPTGGKGESHHLLCGGLSHAAGHTDHGQRKAGTVSRRNPAQGLHRVRHGDPNVIVLLFRVVLRQRRGGSRRKRRGNVGVRVRSLSPDRHKQGSGRNLSAVCAHGGNLRLRIAAEDSPSAGLGNFQRCHLHAASPFSLSARIAAITSRSS